MSEQSDRGDRQNPRAGRRVRRTLLMALTAAPLLTLATAGPAMADAPTTVDCTIPNAVSCTVHNEDGIDRVTVSHEFKGEFVTLVDEQFDCEQEVTVGWDSAYEADRFIVEPCDELGLAAPDPDPKSGLGFTAAPTSPNAARTPSRLPLLAPTEGPSAQTTNEVVVVTPTDAWFCYEDHDAQQSVCEPL